MKSICKLFIYLIIVIVVYYIWNMPGFGGQCLDSPTSKTSAWLGSSGWAGLNGKYTIGLLHANSYHVFKEYEFTCSTSSFAQMRESKIRYMSWNKNGTILTVQIPNEYPIKIIIED